MLAAEKVLSCFSIIIPLGMGAAYAYNSLRGRVVQITKPLPVKARSVASLSITDLFKVLQAEVDLQANKLDEAQAAYNQILDNHPQHLDSLKDLVKVYYKKSRYEQALELLDRAEGIDHKDEEVKRLKQQVNEKQFFFFILFAYSKMIFLLILLPKRANFSLQDVRWFPHERFEETYQTGVMI